jgi:hypothetical protein
MSTIKEALRYNLEYLEFKYIWKTEFSPAFVLSLLVIIPSATTLQ